jgi:hypothetical protein
MLKSVFFTFGLLTLYIQNSWSEFIYGNLIDYALNLTAVYKDPGHVFGEDLLRTAVFYLDELMELEEALQDKKEHERAIQVLSELVEKGGPQHIKDVPYKKFIDTYNWSSKEIDDLARYIEMTSETWGRLVKMAEKYKKAGRFKVKK